MGRVGGGNCVESITYYPSIMRKSDEHNAKATSGGNWFDKPDFTGLGLSGSLVVVICLILLEPTAIVPGVRIANVQVDRLNPTETHEKLNQQLEPLEEFEIVLVNESEQTSAMGD